VARPGHWLPATPVSTPRFPAAVTEVTLPPGARVPYPAGAYAFIAQLVWVLSGRLTLTDGPAEHALAAGDTFELGEPRPREFRNDGAEDCRYLVVVTRTATHDHRGPARHRGRAGPAASRGLPGCGLISTCLRRQPETGRLQELLDRSAAAAGPHLRDIITDERRLSAAAVVRAAAGNAAARGRHRDSGRPAAGRPS